VSGTEGAQEEDWALPLPVSTVVTTVTRKIGERPAEHWGGRAWTGLPRQVTSSSGVRHS
jgi:hypothetical protein